jgi:hypothetical protein
MLDIMVFLQIKEIYLTFIKQGRISLHNTTSKGKRYRRGKIYLKDHTDVGSSYHLYKVDKIHIVDKRKRHKKGKGYIIFIPK